MGSLSPRTPAQNISHDLAAYSPTPGSDLTSLHVPSTNALPSLINDPARLFANPNVKILSATLCFEALTIESGVGHALKKSLMTFSTCLREVQFNIEHATSTRHVPTGPGRQTSSWINENGDLGGKLLHVMKGHQRRATARRVVDRPPVHPVDDAARRDDAFTTNLWFCVHDASPDDDDTGICHRRSAR